MRSVFQLNGEDCFQVPGLEPTGTSLAHSPGSTFMMAVEASASMTMYLASPTWSTSTRDKAFQRANCTQEASRRSPLA